MQQVRLQQVKTPRIYKKAVPQGIDTKLVRCVIIFNMKPPEMSSPDGIASAQSGVKETNVIESSELEKQESLEKIVQAKENDPIRILKVLYPEVDERYRLEYMWLSDRVKAVKEFISEQPPEAIWIRALERFQDLFEKGNINFAYTVAKEYLDRPHIESVAQKLLDAELDKMRQSKVKPERREVAGRILSKDFAPEAQRSTKIIEETLETLHDSRDRRRKESERDVYLKGLRRGALKWLEVPVENEEIAAVAWFVAQEEVKGLRGRDTKRAAETAQLYLNNGILNREKDTKLLEGLV